MTFLLADGKAKWFLLIILCDICQVTGPDVIALLLVYCVTDVKSQCQMLLAFANDCGS